MSIEFRCDQCQRLLRVPEEHAGARARCPQCSKIHTVPAASSPDSPSPPSEAEVFEQQPEPPKSKKDPPPWSLDAINSPSSGGAASAGGAGANPFADRPEGDSNPYSSPYSSGYQTSYSTAGTARSKLMAPAIILIAFAILALLFCGFMAIGGIGMLVDGDDDGIGALIGAAICGFSQLLVLIGCIRMLSLRNYGLAMTAMILSLVCGVCTWITIPFAIWGLVVLCDSDVKRHFT